MPRSATKILGEPKGRYCEWFAVRVFRWLESWTASRCSYRDPSSGRRNPVLGTAKCSNFRGLIRCAWLQHKSAACERWRWPRGLPRRAKKKESTTGACAESVNSRRGEVPVERDPRLAIVRGRATVRWRHSIHFHATRVCFLQPFLAIRNSVECHTGSQRQAEFQSSIHRLFRGTIRHVQNVAGLESHIFRRALQHFFEIDGDFVLLALTVLADDDSSIFLRGTAQATRESQQFQGAHL